MLVSNFLMHTENALKPPELRKRIAYYPYDEKVTSNVRVAENCC